MLPTSLLVPSIIVLLSICGANFGNGNLIRDLKRKLPPSEVATNELYLALMDKPAEHDAKYLHKAMKGLGTDEEALIEILVFRNNNELRAIKTDYKRWFKRDLADDIASETSGNLEKLLLDLLEANRDETPRVDRNQAKKDAQELYDAGENKFGTDEQTFITILANQNTRQLSSVFDEYQKLTNHSIEQAITSEFSGKIRKALLAICGHVRNGPAAEAADFFHKAFENGGKEEQLVHLIVSYSDVDLRDIAREYEKQFKLPLEKDLQNAGTKSATLKNALMTMVKEST